MCYYVTMIQETHTIQITITRDGKLDRMEMYKPIIKDFAINTFNKIDYLFVNGHWPSHDRQNA